MSSRLIFRGPSPKGLSPKLPDSPPINNQFSSDKKLPPAKWKPLPVFPSSFLMPPAGVLPGDDGTRPWTANPLKDGDTDDPARVRRPMTSNRIAEEWRNEDGPSHDEDPLPRVLPEVGVPDGGAPPRNQPLDSNVGPSVSRDAEPRLATQSGKLQNQAVNIVAFAQGGQLNSKFHGLGGDSRPRATEVQEIWLRGRDTDTPGWDHILTATSDAEGYLSYGTSSVVDLNSVSTPSRPGICCTFSTIHPTSQSDVRDEHTNVSLYPTANVNDRPGEVGSGMSVWVGSQVLIGMMIYPPRLRRICIRCVLRAPATFWGEDCHQFCVGEDVAAGK